jgi:hypothetical protein
VLPGDLVSLWQEKTTRAQSHKVLPGIKKDYGEENKN